MGAKWLVILAPAVLAQEPGLVALDMCNDLVAAFDDDNNGLLSVPEFSEYQQMYPMNDSYTVSAFCGVFNCSGSGVAPLDLCNYYETEGDITLHHSSLPIQVVYLRSSGNGTGTSVNPSGSIGTAYAACGNRPCKILMMPSNSVLKGDGTVFRLSTTSVVASPFHKSTRSVPEYLILDCEQQDGLVMISGNYTLKGFTMRNCVNTASGGALSVHDSEIDLIDMHFVRCSGQDGGAVAAFNSHLNISASTFQLNTAKWFGGALYTEGCGVSVKATFVGNRAFSGEEYYCKGGDKNHMVTAFESGGVQVHCDVCMATALTCPTSTLNLPCGSDSNCDSEKEYCTTDRVCKSCRHCSTLRNSLSGYCKACNGNPATSPTATAAPAPFLHNLTTAQSCLCPFVISNADNLPVICTNTVSCGPPLPTCPGMSGHFLCSGSTNYKVSRMWFSTLNPTALRTALINVESMVPGVRAVAAMQCPTAACESNKCTSNKTLLVERGCSVLGGNSELVATSASGFVDIVYHVSGQMTTVQGTRSLLFARSYLAQNVATLEGVSSYEVVDAPHENVVEPVRKKVDNDDSNSCGTACIVIVVLGLCGVCCMMCCVVFSLREKKRREAQPPIQPEPREFSEFPEYVEPPPEQKYAGPAPANPLAMLDNYALYDRRSVPAYPQEHDQRESSSGIQEAYARPAHVTESETDLQRINTEPSEGSLQNGRQAEKEEEKEEEDGKEEEEKEEDVKEEHGADAEPEAAELEGAENEDRGEEETDLGEAEGLGTVNGRGETSVSPTGTPNLTPAKNEQSSPAVSTPAPATEG